MPCYFEEQLDRIAHCMIVINNGNNLVFSACHESELLTKSIRVPSSGSTHASTMTPIRCIDVDQL